MTDPERMLILFSDGLLSKWGFNDGDLPEEFYEWWHETRCPPSCFWECYAKVPDKPVIQVLVRRFLLPALDQRVEVYDIGTIHNPIRASSVDGLEVPDEVIYGSTRGPALTPASVEVPYAEVAKVIDELAGLPVSEEPR